MRNGVGVFGYKLIKNNTVSADGKKNTIEFKKYSNYCTR